MAPKLFLRMRKGAGVMSSHFLIVQPLTHTMLPLSGYRPRRARSVLCIFPYGKGGHLRRLSHHNRSQVQKLTLLNKFRSRK